MNHGKHLLSFFIVAIVFFSFFMGTPPSTIASLYHAVASEVLQKDSEVTVQNVISDYVDSFWGHSQFISLNGKIASFLNMRGFYSDIGIYVDEDDYVISAYSKTSTDYEFNQLLQFKQYLDEKGINLMYVNAFTKYVDDDVPFQQFAIHSFVNQNADHLLQRLEDANIATLDLRDHVAEECLDVKKMFYRTDHHWTVPSGFWATEIIAKSLNNQFGYHIDNNLYDPNQYTFTDYHNCWVGEQGRKLSEAYIGTDDFTKITPNFSTNFSIITPSQIADGNFDIMLRSSIFEDPEKNKNISWHYSYMPQKLTSCSIINHNVSEGKILLLCDSFSYVVAPFLSLGVSELDTIILRSFDGDLQQYIESSDIDTVVILYAPFMIGAHDNPKSANYEMFTFECATQ